MKYDSNQFRQGKLKLNGIETKLMRILMEFGESIDPHGLDDGNYDVAIEKLLKIIYGK